MLPDFVVTTVRHGSTTIVRCVGELDLATCERLDESLLLALEERPQRIVFDGSGVTLLTSAGISSLFNLAQACKGAEITLELRLSCNARRVLDLVGLWWLGVVDDGLAVEDSLSDALKAYAQRAPRGRLLREIAERQAPDLE